ncbi:4Fe-4S binding protein [Anaeromicrobium sediminis]|uniref:Ferredoxin n=1 Tax=Anaeromicrobium sediminis TaxID=1478221 RepID=A0A267MIU7_9FIRM|nr:4Fe-4S binding protein [Anaeromicrobium sediminis]PAB59342.1 ferredoxin [Anaeromicrobium sediminis]
MSVKINEKVTWRDITPGGTIYDAGNSSEFKTGDWRVLKPVFVEEKCKQCLLCAPVCPDSAVPVENKVRGEFDYDHCKGCGICMKVCPFDAIQMVSE